MTPSTPPSAGPRAQFPADGKTDQLLNQILRELRTARSIPSTALRLRAESVEDSVRYIRGDSRFDLAQVTQHNPDALRIALSEAPTWPGLVAEFGVYSGASLKLMAEHFPDQAVHGFDSFAGLPERWTGSKEAVGAFDVGGCPPSMDAPNVEFHVGWFDQTVPEFARSTSRPFRFVHLDADLYSSTRTVFEHLGDRLTVGSVIVFDEYFGYHAWRHHEHKAFMEFLGEYGLSFEAIVIGHMSLGVRLVRP